MKYALTIATTALAGALCVHQAGADTISLRADIWPPYNATPGSDKPGYIAEIAIEIWNNQGHEVDYSTIPWERAITEARTGNIDCILGALPDEVPDFVFHSLPLGLDQSTFYTRSANHWTYHTPAQLDDIRLGVIGGYSYDQGVVDEHIASTIREDASGSRVQLMKGDNALEKNLQKLLSGRIDAIVGSATVVNYTVATLGMEGAVRPAGNIGVADKLYIACSPATPEKSETYTRQLDEGIQRLRKSGRLTEILERYGLQDWSTETPLQP
ncbi:MAG: transporter substrate-binding domain-containing protein [Pseudomonadota bacterium]|nr:transporter substrate-binding domain-containing protein [Pseudomonadota bacterium]